MEVLIILNQMKKHPLILGTFLLTGAGIISRVLGFFYRIFLSKVIGASGLGLYQLIFPVFSLCLAISSSGIQTAISRFVAAEKSGKKYLFSGLFISVLLSGIFSLAIHFLAPWIATDILKEPRTQELLQIMVYALIPACIHSCFNGYYYGKKNSTIPSACQIIEQLARVFGVYIIYQVLLQQNLPLEPIHAVWGLVISELAGLLVNLTAYFGSESCDGGLRAACKTSAQSQNLVGFCTDTLHTTLPPLAAMAFPLSLNHVLMTLSHAIEDLLIPQQLVDYGYTADEALSHFGILSGMAMSVIFFPAVITNSLSVLLLPRISEAKAKGDKSLVLDTIKGALCCGVALGSLCTFIFLFTSEWIGVHIFDNTLAGFYVQILSILCPFMYTASLLSSIVNGLGYASLTLMCNLIGCAIRIVAIWFFMPVYGMYAYIVAMIISHVMTMAGLIGVVVIKCRNITPAFLFYSKRKTSQCQSQTNH